MLPSEQPVELCYLEEADSDRAHLRRGERVALLDEVVLIQRCHLTADRDCRRLLDDERKPNIRLDPGIQFGAPCVAGTRLPTAQLFALREAGESVDQLASLFGQTADRVEAALNFEQALARAA